MTRLQKTVLRTISLVGCFLSFYSVQAQAGSELQLSENLLDSSEGSLFGSSSVQAEPEIELSENLLDANVTPNIFQSSGVRDTERLDIHEQDDGRMTLTFEHGFNTAHDPNQERSGLNFRQPNYRTTEGAYYIYEGYFDIPEDETIREILFDNTGQYYPRGWFVNYSVFTTFIDRHVNPTTGYVREVYQATSNEQLLFHSTRGIPAIARQLRGHEQTIRNIGVYRVENPETLERLLEENE